MKKRLLHLALLFCLPFAIYSCKEEGTQDIEEIENNQEPQKGSTDFRIEWLKTLPDYRPETKSLSNDFPSTSNPELKDNWENVDIIYLNAWNYPGACIDAPWIYKEGSSNGIPIDFRTDIKKKDGWKMLFHTLLKSTLLEPNYIIFYNPEKMLIKGFYYSLTPFLNRSFEWVMTMYDTTNNTRDYIISTNKRRESVIKIEAIIPGWNAFEFHLTPEIINNAECVTFEGCGIDSQNKMFQLTNSINKINLKEMINKAK